MDLHLPASAAPAGDAPLRQFRGAHDGILRGVEELQELPALAAALARARTTAAHLLELFDTVVPAHHADEEQELFVSVLRSCRDEAEAAVVSALVAQLTAEHRAIESAWRELRPAVAQTAAGRPHAAALFGAGCDRLADLYAGHARLEEEVFLPLADAILGRNANHMAALGVALHLRHAPPPRAAYI